MTNQKLLQEVEKDKEKKKWKNKITKIKKDVMTVLKKSNSLKSFYSKTKRSLDSLEKLDKEHRYKLDITIQNWVIFQKPEWEKDLISFPNPNPEKKYNLADYVFWDKFDDERPKFKFDPKQSYKVFLENDFLHKYFGLSKFFHFGRKDDYLDDFIVNLKSTPYFKRFNIIVFFIVNYFEENIKELEFEIKNLKQDRIYLYELSKKIKEVDRYEIIIDGILKGTFELSKLKDVINYIFKSIPDKNNSKSDVTQIVDFLYITLRKKYTKSYIQSFLLKSNRN